MTNTTPLALIAARVNRGDLVECRDGQTRTVADYALNRPGFVTWTFEDGTTETTSLLRTVMIYA
jgi:hypothetical protein